MNKNYIWLIETYEKLSFLTFLKLIIIVLLIFIHIYLYIRYKDIRVELEESENRYLENGPTWKAIKDSLQLLSVAGGAYSTVITYRNEKLKRTCEQFDALDREKRIKKLNSEVTEKVQETTVYQTHLENSSKFVAKTLDLVSKESRNKEIVEELNSPSISAETRNKLLQEQQTLSYQISEIKVSWKRDLKALADNEEFVKKLAEMSKKSMLSFLEDLLAKFEVLPAIEKFSTVILLSSSIIFSLSTGVIFILYGNYLIAHYNLEKKVPWLAKFINYRKKFSRYFLIYYFGLIFSTCLIQILFALAILSV